MLSNRVFKLLHPDEVVLSQLPDEPEIQGALRSSQHVAPGGAKCRSFFHFSVVIFKSGFNVSFLLSNQSPISLDNISQGFLQWQLRDGK